MKHERLTVDKKHGRTCSLRQDPVRQVPFCLLRVVLPGEHPGFPLVYNTCIDEIANEVGGRTP